jgi:hypothetical protein
MAISAEIVRPAGPSLARRLARIEPLPGVPACPQSVNNSYRLPIDPGVTTS